MKPLIEIRTGSDSDIPKIKNAYEVLDRLGVPYSPRILSAHRTPAVMMQEAKALADNGYRVSIAAAGGSAHLPGMTASETVLPVVAIPVRTRYLEGIDSLYSMVQMPPGIPVGCVGIGQAESAALLAVQIAYQDDPEVRNGLRNYRGLEEELTSEAGSNLIGVVEPEGMRHKFGKDAEEAFRLLRKLSEDVQLKHYSLSVVDNHGMKKVTQQLAEQGARAILAFGEMDEENGSLYFPQFIAQVTDIPVIGVPLVRDPVAIHSWEGNVFSQMLTSFPPEEAVRGYPIAGMAINGLHNAVLYAIQILGIYDPEVQQNFKDFRADLAESVKEKDRRLQELGVERYSQEVLRK